MNEETTKNSGTSEGMTMGDFNPIVRERRSTIGYAFSQEDDPMVHLGKASDKSVQLMPIQSPPRMETRMSKTSLNVSDDEAVKPATHTEKEGEDEQV